MMLRCCRRPGLLRLILQTRSNLGLSQTGLVTKNGSWWHQDGGTCSLNSVQVNGSQMAVLAAHQLSSHLLGFFMYVCMLPFVTLCYPLSPFVTLLGQSSDKKQQSKMEVRC